MVGLLKELLNRTEKTEEKTEEWPKERTENEMKNVVRYFTDYKVVIEYSDGTTRTEHATKYSDEGDTLHLYDGSPYFDTYHQLSRRFKNIPARRSAKIDLRHNDPLIISYANTNSVKIEENEKLVAVIEDVEVEVVYRQYGPDEEWEEVYHTFERDDDRDYGEEITEWFRSEWKNRQS